MTDHADKARELMADIRYQVFRPEVTTMGPCATDGCANSSRGGMRCADCLAAELDATAKPEPAKWPEGALGMRYLHACNMQREAEREVLDHARQRGALDALTRDWQERG